MRRIRYQVAMSLDGYIAGPNGEADWILMDPDIDFGSIFSQFDTLLMGRKTFEAAGDGGGMFAGMRIVVVSRTLDASRHKGITVIADDVASAVTALKNETGKDIWLFGGGDLFRSLMELDLVDTVEPAVIPVLLGGGLPLLPPSQKRAELTLKRHRVYEKTGTALLEYEVKKNGSATRTAAPRSDRASKPSRPGKSRR